MTINSMRSTLEPNGQILLTVTGEMVVPLRNAVQKLAGGMDFFELDEEERDILDLALRHLWNPGDDAEETRESTIPIEVLALAMRDRIASQKGDLAPVSRQPGRSRGTSRPKPKKETQPTVRINRVDHPGSPTNETKASRSDGYRPPTKGRHTDISR